MSKPIDAETPQGQSAMRSALMAQELVPTFKPSKKPKTVFKTVFNGLDSETRAAILNSLPYSSEIDTERKVNFLL